VWGLAIRTVNQIMKENCQESGEWLRTESSEKEKQSTALLSIFHPEKVILLEKKSARKSSNRGRMHLSAQWEWTGMKLFLVVYEFRYQICLSIVVGRDPNRIDLDLVYFKLMICPGDLCSGQLYDTDLCRDEGIQTGKRPLDGGIIWIRYSTVQCQSGILALGVAWIIGGGLGGPISKLVIASCRLARG
jgi:hypothetical protein